MSRTGCQLAGFYKWTVVTDEDGWDAIAVTCTDWECGEHRWVEGHPETDEKGGYREVADGG